MERIIIQPVTEIVIVDETESTEETYDEPTEDALIQYANSFPLLECYEKVRLRMETMHHLNTYVLPLNIPEIWEFFYEDQSLFYAADSFAETIDSYNNWYTPTENLYKDFCGDPSSLQRDVVVTFHLPPNPFAETG